MKKFAVIKGVGTWGYEKGRKVINCTVQRYELVADSNDATELSKAYPVYQIVYADNGEWYHYRLEKRASAKVWLSYNK